MTSNILLPFLFSEWFIREVERARNLIETEISFALDGRVEKNATIPAFLTPRGVLDIYREILKTCFREINNYVKELTQNGQQFSFADPMVTRKIQLIEREVK